MKKISVALDEAVAAEAAAAAEAGGKSLSAWLNDAARSQLRIEAGLAGVRAWRAEHGALTEGEMASARMVLARLSAPPPRDA